MLPGLSEEQERDPVLSVGTGLKRRRLKPLVVADYIRRVIDAGGSLADVATRVGLKSSTMLGRFLRLNDLDDTVRSLVDWGSSGTTISPTSASELARLSRPDQKVVAMQALERNLSGDEVEQIVQYGHRSRKSIGECIDAIVRIRPAHSQRYVFVGTLQNDGLRKMLDEIEDHDRNAMLRSVIEESFPGLRGTAHYRLTPDRYIINSAVDVASIVETVDVDSLVDSALRRRVNKS